MKAQLPPLYYALMEMGGLQPENVPLQAIENVFEAFNLQLDKVMNDPLTYTKSAARLVIGIVG